MLTSIEDESGRILLRNSYYPNSRIASQTLGDEILYRYRWDLASEGWVRHALVQTPGGTIWEYPFNKGVPAGQPRIVKDWTP